MLNKSSSLAAALGVTKAMNLVTVCCAASASTDRPLALVLRGNIRIAVV